jgi:hypothetical protein
LIENGKKSSWDLANILEKYFQKNRQSINDDYLTAGLLVFIFLFQAMLSIRPDNLDSVPWEFRDDVISGLIKG